MRFFPSDLLTQLCHRTVGTVGGGLRVLELLVGFAQLHSPSPSLAPKYGSHLKPFVYREGGGGLGKEGDRRVGGGRGVIYLNNLVVMKAAWARWRWKDKVSGEGRVNGVKSNCRQIVGPDNV